MVAGAIFAVVSVAIVSTISAERNATLEHRRMLADSVADFTGRGTDLARIRRLRGDPAGHDRAVWRSMADLGWLGILVPERYGGLGLGLAEMAIVA
jgi:alkylation response protein AidB-like acyl-CoA dehydrogenase